MQATGVGSANVSSPLHRMVSELEEREDELVDQITRVVVSSDTSTGARPSLDELRRVVTMRHRATLRALSRRHSREEHPHLTAAGAETFRLDADTAAVPRDGEALPALLLAESITSGFVWRTMIEIGHRHGISRHLMIEIAGDIFAASERHAADMTRACAAESAAKSVRRRRSRSAFVDRLLSDAPLEALTLWEVAEALHLRRSGHFVIAVAVADGLDPDDPSRGDSERRLAAAGFVSAWMDGADTQTGIISVPGGASKLPALVCALDEPGRQTRVGLSPSFSELGDAMQFLPFARVALLAARSGHRRVCVFDENLLAVSAAAAPEVNRQVASRVLVGLATLDQTQRDVLLETLQAWMDCDGSTPRAAEQLYLHRNTVNQRLRRVERLTGRSLTSPRHVAELCIALAGYPDGYLQS